MSKYYDGPLDKNMDFTNPVGDGRPASGLAVQNYIKDIDDRKIAVGDQFGDKYYFFGSLDEMNEFREDPSKTYLIMSQIQLEEQYILRIYLDGDIDYYPIFIGDVGNYVRYTFTTTDKDGILVREPVDAKYVITCGSNRVEVNETYQSGAEVAFNVDKYIQQGNNIVSITLTGRNTGASRMATVVFQAIDIAISDDFDISRVYHRDDSLVVSGHITGSGERYLEWYVDGVKQQPVPGDVITGVGEMDYSRTLPIDVLTSGRHNIQYRAFVKVQGDANFYSNTLYRDFVIDDEMLEGVTILTKFELPRDTETPIDAFTQPIPLTGPVQYEEFVMNYAIYSKNDSPSESLTIVLGDNSGNYVVSNNHIYEYSIHELTATPKLLNFICGNTTLAYNAIIETSDYKLDPITDTQFEFSGSDRTNSSDDRDDWSFKSYTANLTGFGWTESSGWYGGRLIIPDGALFATDNFAPFINDIKTNGFTFEMEFSTSHIFDENTVILDLTSNGHGLIVTANEISFSSRNGKTVNTKYKPDENVRVSVVINPPTTGINKGLIFIYVDGIMTGATTYTADDGFISAKKLQIGGTSGATIAVKQIRTYARPLSSDEIVTNFILYRDTAAELVKAYDRNDIYDETGSHLSVDKLLATTPAIIITGNVNKLQNFTKDDKSTYVRMDKIEVINMQDPTKNLTLINPSMRCQGTSSMEYPRKNFRFYTQADSKDSTQPKYTTRMFDYQGQEYFGEDRLYSFKDNAQPVKCWCLKADYAESSSTHNTGVARMWNEYMKNARIDTKDIDERYYIKSLFPKSNTPCRTIAQHVAERDNYEYDVRTTVDGFPIVLFFHAKEEDPLTFLGRYNWNNDKSTESVYGFCDIPNFDDSNVECWEVVNGDYPCNLFTDISHWTATDNSGWRKSFEARYPNDHGEESEATRGDNLNGALYRVSSWINSTMGASVLDDDPTSSTYEQLIVGDPVKMAKFSSEKWDHLDVYKVAAYYVYLMRFGAVDQTVKNAMFTTEDGDHWFYINYDNDTINGVENSGALTVEYTANRQTKLPGSTNSYRYAGHDSVLWNNLEADTEFMNIVYQVDDALYKIGLTYAEVINMFNEEQSAKWSEKTHNEDYAYKYINISDRNQLTKLQGPRKSHRQWWLSNRFAVYDAIFGTSSYINNNIGIKPNTAGEPTANEYVTVTPAVNNQIFGYGYETPAETGVRGVKDVPIRFNMSQRYYEGTLIKFYNAVYLKEINFSRISQYIKELNVAHVNTEAFDTQLTSLILGDEDSESNVDMKKIENLENFKYLENFKMMKFNSISDVRLSNNKYLKTIDLRDCESLGGVELPVAAPITSIKYPSSITSINVTDLLSLTTLEVQDYGPNIHNIAIYNCPKISKSPDLILNWIDNRDSSISDENCTVYMDNVDWTISVADLKKIGLVGYDSTTGKQRGNLTLIGTAKITSSSYQSIGELVDIFGPSIIDPTAAFHITSDVDVCFIQGPSTTLEGDSIDLTAVVLSKYDYTTEWTYSSSRIGTFIEPDGNICTVITTENGLSTGNVTVTCTVRSVYGVTTASKTVSIVQRVYPTQSQIHIGGSSLVEDGNVYPVVFDINNVTGRMVMEWSISGDITNNVDIAEYDNEKCVLEINTPLESITVGGTLTLVVKKYIDNTTIGTYTKNIGLQRDDIAVSSAVNSLAMAALYAGLNSKGKCEHEDYMTKDEATTVTYADLNSGSSYSTSIFYSNTDFRTQCTDFPEFKYFTGVVGVPSYCFYSCTALNSIEFPTSCKDIGNYAFYGCNNLDLGKTNLASSDIRNIGSYGFSMGTSSLYNRATKEMILPDSLKTIGTYCFSNYINVNNIKFPNNPDFKTIPYYAFFKLGYNLTENHPSLEFPDNIETIAGYAFNSSKCSKIVFNDTSHLTSIESNCFSESNNSALVWTDVHLPSSLISIGQKAFYKILGDSGSIRGILDLSNLNNVVSWGTQAFDENNYYKLILPTNMEVTPSGVFGGVASSNVLYEVVWPTNVRVISTNTIKYNNIGEINFPEGVEEIQNNAIWYQYNVQLARNVTIPSTITYLEGCFAGAYVSKYISNSSQFVTRGGGNTIVDEDTHTLVAVTRFANSGDITIDNDILHIGKYAYSECIDINSIIIPDTLLSINDFAFYVSYGSSGKLASVSAPNGAVISIGSWAFGRAGSYSSLSSMTFTNITFNNIGGRAFYDCPKLAGIINLSNDIETIGDQAFFVAGKNSSSGFTISSIPSTLKYIGYQAFYNSGIAGSVTIPGVNFGDNFGYEVFKGCTKLNSITFTEGFNVNASSYLTSSPGTYCLDGCTNLTNVSIPSTLTTIPLYFCQNIGKTAAPTTVTMANGVNTILNYTFSNSKLTSPFEIPSSVTTIMASIFSSFTTAENVILRPTTPPAFNLGVASAWSGVTKIYVPYGCGNAYKNAAGWTLLSSKIYELDQNGNIPS